MSVARVALIGPPDRLEFGRLAVRLEERGGEAIVIDSRADPAIRLARDRVEACGVDLSGIRGVYVVDLGIRPVRGASAEGARDPEAAVRSLESSRRHLAAWNALLERLAARGPVVNPPATHDLHALKPFESTVYSRAGIPIPATVASSDPEALRSLPNGETAGWVSKGMVGGYTHTEAIDPPRDREAAARLLQDGPRMLQHRVEGDNVRAFVLDGRVIGAAEVVSAAGGEVDSRKGESRVRRVPLPDDAARDAVAAAGRWGMPFAAVDFMRDEATGRYLVLECNSAPFFVTFESRAGLDLSGRLADYLLGRPPR